MKSIERIVAIGDSIVFGRIDPPDGGWVGRLRTVFTEAAPTSHAVFNLGIGGDTTRDLLARLENECSVRKPDLILISVGANDSRSEESPTAPPKIPIGEFQQNFERILRQAGKIATPVVVSMVPVDERRTMPTHSGLYHSLSVQEEYARATEQVTAKVDVAYVDVFSDWLRRGRWRYAKLLADGVHPNSRGHKAMYEAVSAVLKERRLLKL